MKALSNVSEISDINKLLQRNLRGAEKSQKCIKSELKSKLGFIFKLNKWDGRGNGYEWFPQDLSSKFPLVCRGKQTQLLEAPRNWGVNWLSSGPRSSHLHPEAPVSADISY